MKVYVEGLLDGQTPKQHELQEVDVTKAYWIITKCGKKVKFTSGNAIMRRDLANNIAGRCIRCAFTKEENHG